LSLLVINDRSVQRSMKILPVRHRLQHEKNGSQLCIIPTRQRLLLQFVAICQIFIFVSASSNPNNNNYNTASPPPPSGIGSVDNDQDQYYRGDDRESSSGRNSGYDYDRRQPPPRRPDEEHRSQQQQQSPWSRKEADASSGGNSDRPPPPFARRTPIHYEFQAASATAPPKKNARRDNDKDVDGDSNDVIPFTSSLMDVDGDQEESFREDGDRGRGRRGGDRYRDDRDRRDDYQSARRDAVTQHMSTKRGRLTLTTSSGIVGAAAGGFIGKSITGHPKPFAIGLCFAMVFCTLLRNAYGELSKALGLTLIYAFQKTSAIRKRYPTMVHIKSCLGAGPRRSFPPGGGNPWRYQPERDGDVEFRMLYAIIAMTFIGSVCGGNINVPLFPTWLGALGGAGIFALACTFQNARGDLARTMGMRFVGLAQEVIEINAELGVLRKSAVVGGKILDKCLILDRKHRIKDRLAAGFQWGYNQVMRTVDQAQSGGGRGRRDDRRRDGGRRGDDERRRGDRDRDYDRDRDREDDRDRDRDRGRERDRDDRRDYDERPRRGDDDSDIDERRDSEQGDENTESRRDDKPNNKDRKGSGRGLWRR